MPDFPGFDSIYDLSTGFHRRAFVADAPDESLEDLHAFHAGERQPAEPVVYRHASGTELRDVVWASSLMPLVRVRVADLLVSEGITGWSSFPARLYDREGAEVTGYCGLAVTGRCGPIDDSLSQPFQREFPGGTFPYLRGLYFDRETWDGSDVFRPADTLYVFVTERVKVAFARANVRNVVFQRLSEDERPA